MAKMGRPTKYNEKLTQEICKRISEGASVRSIAKHDDMPDLSTIMKWRAEKDDFSERYEKACNARAELLFEELLDIADDGSNDYMEKERENGTVGLVIDKEHVQRSRLRVDTRKWFLAKVMPKKYGDKSFQDITSDGEKIQAININVRKNEENS